MFKLSSPQLRYHPLLMGGQLLLEKYPMLSGKAHIGLVTDVQLDVNRIRTHAIRNRYRVAVIKKTPTTWWEAASLYIMRKMALYGRITVIER